MAKVGFFEEVPGVRSSTRVQSFILMWFLMIWDTLLLYNDGFTINYNFVLFNLVMLVAIFTPKYLHKLAEVRMHKETEKE